MMSQKKLDSNNNYLNCLFLKYWAGSAAPEKDPENNNDGVSYLSDYPDKLIWNLHYEHERFGNEDALKFRKFLLVPGVEELINKRLFNAGDLLTCRHLNETQGARLVEIYNEDKQAWKDIERPKLIDLIFKGENGYDVATKEEARKIAQDPSKISEFAMTHDVRLKLLSSYQNAIRFVYRQPSFLKQEPIEEKTHLYSGKYSRKS